VAQDPAISDPRTRSAFGRFLLAGVFNTAVTYGLYLVLLWFLSYRVSYTISYVAGIALAYELNRGFVFRARRSAASLAATPLIYLLNYLIGLGIVSLTVGGFGLDARVGPLIAIVCTIPVTFVLTRWVFRRGDANLPS
jgi:putative flippase GtrA